MKISILIPVNDYDIVALVHSMREGMSQVREFCEILIGDDGSSEDFRKKYRQLAGDDLKVISSEKNIGRAAIRNKLIDQATGDYLLFIDADAMIRGTAEDYLGRWVENLSLGKVICGGILYKDTSPGDPDKYLRWNYGRHKEQKKASERNKNPNASFSTFNVLIAREVFSKLRFYEELRQYGYEDILLSYQLKKAGIDIVHIDNGLVHEGLETNREFLTKTKSGIENLSKLYDHVTDKKTFTSTVSLLNLFLWLRRFHVTRIIAGFFIKYREKMEIRLESTKASLKLFKLYKISMFCTYREIHRRRKILPIFNIPPEII
ncbi:MAG: glycosyltransferase [Bacteroidales bacterium]|jgi:GT2 family glycosyltransferase|nr:glycosyltransferase [Bacteroidales bacterium]